MNETDLPTIYATLGQNVRALRKARGLSQTELAQICNMEPSNLNRLENGHTNPSVRTLMQIANALHLPLKKFFVNL